MGKIAFYTDDIEKQKQLLAIGRKQNAQMQKIRRQDIGCSVASVLAGKPQPAKGDAGRVPALYAQPEILIFSGFSEAEFDALLEALRTSPMAPIPLKAVVTPFNCLWSVRELSQELQREHKVVTGR